MMEQSSAEESCCGGGVNVPPGFRFHPTEEELVGYYLARKVQQAAASSSSSSHHNIHNMDLHIIQEVDLYRIEPWDLRERCSSKQYGGAGGGEQTAATEWYFFSYKDRKYPSGTRTNRATAAGFWKATGRDKPVLSCSRVVIGMRKTLVFYKGRAPNGSKTHWIMHEYRLVQTNHHHAHAQEEGWVVCRAFQKPIPNQQRPCSFFPSYGATPAAGGYYDDYEQSYSYLPPNARLMHVLADHRHRHFLHPASSPGPAAAANGSSSFFPPPPQLYSDDDDDCLLESKTKQQQRLLFSSGSLPQLESPTNSAIACAGAVQQQQQGSYDDDYSAAAENELTMIQGGGGGGGGQEAAFSAAAGGGAIDWSFLDTLLSVHDIAAPRALI